jgi:hypothetical protein
MRSSSQGGLAREAAEERLCVLVMALDTEGKVNTYHLAEGHTRRSTVGGCWTCTGPAASDGESGS